MEVFVKQNDETVFSIGSDTGGMLYLKDSPDALSEVADVLRKSLDYVNDWQAGRAASLESYTLSRG
jgi:hypothetical protein